MKHWSISVERDGENIVTIESNWLFGRNLSLEDEETIRLAARNLLAFVGAPIPEFVYRAALESIAGNACCTPCREAKLVAQKALDEADADPVWVPCPSCAHLSVKPAYCDRCEGGGIVRALESAGCSPRGFTPQEGSQEIGSAIDPSSSPSSAREEKSKT